MRTEAVHATIPTNELAEAEVLFRVWRCCSEVIGIVIVLVIAVLQMVVLPKAPRVLWGLSKLLPHHVVLMN